MAPSETALLNPPPGMSQPGTPTWEIAYLFPAQGEWDESEYLSLGTNWMVEYADGCLEVLPMPTLKHQLIVDFLVDQLKAFVHKHADGRVLFAPLPVRLWAGKFRDPDVFYLSKERFQASRDYAEGADLVMEVVSEGAQNRERDLNIKRAEYAKAGIAEYWIVDPEQETISVFVLAGSEYRQQGEFSAGQVASSRLLDGFAVAVVDVLSGGSEGG